MKTEERHYIPFHVLKLAYIGNLSEYCCTQRREMDKVSSIKTICVFSAFILTMFLWGTVAGTNFYKFRRNPAFDGYRCSRDKTIYQTLASNMFDCADTCNMNSFCYSFSYQQETGICVGCSDFYNSEILKGSSYFGRYCK